MSNLKDDIINVRRRPKQLTKEVPQPSAPEPSSEASPPKEEPELSPIDKLDKPSKDWWIAQQEQVKKDLEAASKDLNDRQMTEAIVHNLAQLAGAYYGLKNNVDISGLEFDKTNWEAKRKSAIDQAKSKSDSLDKELVSKRRLLAEDIESKEKAGELTESKQYMTEGGQPALLDGKGGYFIYDEQGNLVPAKGNLVRIPDKKAPKFGGKTLKDGLPYRIEYIDGEKTEVPLFDESLLDSELEDISLSMLPPNLIKQVEKARDPYLKESLKLDLKQGDLEHLVRIANENPAGISSIIRSTIAKQVGDESGALATADVERATFTPEIIQNLISKVHMQIEEGKLSPTEAKRMGEFLALVKRGVSGKLAGLQNKIGNAVHGRALKGTFKGRSNPKAAYELATGEKWVDYDKQFSELEQIVNKHKQPVSRASEAPESTSNSKKTSFWSDPLKYMGIGD